jgi:glycosyltransferase involved in cell wall biosynthesis
MIGTDPDGQGGVAAVVAAYRRGGLFERLTIEYVVTHRSGSLIGKLWCALMGGVRIAALLLTGRVILLHAHVSSHGSFRRKSWYLAFARWRGVPTIFHLHSGGFRSFIEEQASQSLRKRILRTLRHSTHLVALSDSWEMYLRSLAPDAHTLMLPNPVDIPPASVLHEGVPGRLLFLGRASDSKGVYDLLEAFTALVKTCPHARLAIGGDGDLNRLRRRIADLDLEDRVEVLGWVTGEEKFAQFVRAQIYVLPSYHEGLPVGMLEAMALSKAVVVTPVGGVPEAVENGVHGLLVNPGDIAGLTAALAELITNHELRRALGQGARLRVTERYATHLVLAQIEAMYGSVLSRRGSQR